MQAKFTVSEDEYMRAVRFGSPLAQWRIGLLVLMGLALSAGAVWGSWPMRVASMAGLVALAVVVVGARLFLLDFMARRTYRKYKAIQMAVRAELMAEGLALGSRDGQGLLRWENVLKWRHNGEFVLIYLAPRLFHIVPKSIASQGFDLNGLVQALESKVGPAI